ncbi:MAG: hypothetical protein WAQ98_11295 [Blastocatellia bacterium]
MSTGTLSQTLSLREIRTIQAVQLLNSLGFESWQSTPVSPIANQIVGHEEIHELVHAQPEINLDLIPEEIKNTPQLVAHALNHSKQANLHYRHECNFWEDLPEPTVQEAVKDVFGLRAVTPARTSAERQADNFLIHRSFHERLAAEARAEEAAAEAQAQENNFQLEAESYQTETKLFPTFTGLKLKNSDRAEKDGYLLYVGNRSDCVRAASSCQKGSVKANSKDGSSWKFLLKLSDVVSDTQQAFNFKLFASSAIQSYKSKNAA